MRSPLLWEWMVAFGILICVAAVFWPITACACKQASPRNACLSNVKQSGIGILMYVSDNNDLLPNRDRWMDAIDAYVKHKGVFQDPEVKTPGHYGYSYDSRLSDKSALSFDDHRNQSMVFDSVNMGKNASDPVISLPQPGRHKGGNNMVYLDGHAKGLKAPK